MPKNNFKMSKKTGKYVFVLKGVNINKVNEKYNISIISNLVNKECELPSNITKINDLTSSHAPRTISFSDEVKRLRICNISMIDFNTKNNINCYNHDYNCFWCHNPFDETIGGIGCPIKYVSNKAIKNYYSEISKDVYTINENITTKCKDRMKINNNVNLKIKEGEYYETDGIFCSFNCCKSFIEDNRHRKLYHQSMYLLTKIYKQIYKIDKIKNLQIISAPHWRMLEEYGGNLTIKKFRNNFNKVEYENHGVIKLIPEIKPIGMLFEEKLKFQ
jgi:hypothetical protein